MYKTLSTLLSLLWVAAVGTLYVWQIQLVPSLCKDDGVGFCFYVSNVYYGYFTLYAALFLIVGVGICNRWQQWWHYLIFGFLALPTCMYMQQLTLEHLGDYRTYGYEVFHMTFHGWLAFMAILTSASLLFSAFLRFSVKLAIWATVVASIVFVFTGRGGFEHLVSLIGGTYMVQNWEAVQSSVLLWAVVALLGLIVTSWIIVAVSVWIHQGTFRLKDGATAMRLLIFLPILLFPLITIPFGALLKNNDVRKAKTYIDELIPELKDYYAEEKEYPKAIEDMIASKLPLPRILKRHDFLLNDTPGAFYLSRPEQYCFVFQDPARLGYYSITPFRDWKYSHEGQSLQEHYASICDADEDSMQMSLVAGHLGLEKPEDPIAELQVKMGNVVRPALTADETNELEDELDELGMRDPSIYPEEDPLPFPPTREDLKDFLSYFPEQKGTNINAPSATIKPREEVILSPEEIERRRNNMRAFFQTQEKKIRDAMAKADPKDFPEGMEEAMDNYFLGIYEYVENIDPASLPEEMPELDEITE